MGDLEPECDCGAWDHCGHTAALCYQVARLLDEDPFVLLLMRGRAERALLDDVQNRGAVRGGGSAGPEGVDAAEVYATKDILPALPALPLLPGRARDTAALTPTSRPRPGWTPPRWSSWPRGRRRRRIGCLPRRSGRIMKNSVLRRSS